MLDGTTESPRRLIRKTRTRLVAVVLIAAAMTLASGIPAHAADPGIATVKVGSSASVTGYTTYVEFGAKYSLSVRGNWTAHTSTSAKLTSFTICSGSLRGTDSGVYVFPSTYRLSGATQDFTPKIVPSTGCVTWAVNKTYTKQSNGELIRIYANVKKHFENQQIVSFTR